jgi:2'-5' RNA ligase
MRAFIAIDVPSEIRERLASLQNDLRTTGGTARWVATDSIHLTLKFIGEIREQRIEVIDAALAGLAWRNFSITVRGVGFFPGARSPRVLFAGLKAPTMEALAEQIDTRLERAGFEREKRKFRPHITLARTKNGRLEKELVAAAAKLADLDFGSYTVDRFFLYQSTLKPGGSVYTKVREYRL